MEYFKKFNSNADYNAYNGTTSPFVAWCVAENEIHYVKWTGKVGPGNLTPVDPSN